MGNYGALNSFGTAEYLAGVAGGKYLAGKGAKKIMCHIQNPGAVNLETRCKGGEDGAKEAGAEVYILRVPANLDQDMVGTSEAIKAELIADPSIDVVINLAGWATDASASAIGQQPYLQGNQCVYNVPSLIKLRDAVGPVIGANLNPLHLFWMGTGPLVADEALGEAIYHVHAKDTMLNAAHPDVPERG